MVGSLIKILMKTLFKQERRRLFIVSQNVLTEKNIVMFYLLFIFISMVLVDWFIEVVKDNVSKK